MYDISSRDLVLGPFRVPQNEAAQYHKSSRRGFFAICYSTREGRERANAALRLQEAGRDYAPKDLGAGFRQLVFNLKDFSRVIDDPWAHIGTDTRNQGTEIWISQAGFSAPNRQKRNLAHVSVCWVDIDLHHANSPARLRRLTREDALDVVMERISERELPLPSIVIWTGRGLCVKWYTDTLPRQAYPRWAAVQSALVDVFDDLGADSKARDASRVLRLVGTYNRKSHSLCEPLYVTQSFGDVERVLFDDLANAVLPLTRQQLEELRRQRAAQREVREPHLKSRMELLQHRDSRQSLRTFNPIMLAWSQVGDYRTLAALRPVEQRPEGWTNTLVWMATSALAVAVWADADRCQAEIPDLCRELAPHWSDARIARATASVRSRMQAMARGEWVDWRGTKRPPVYTPRHQTVINELGITDKEIEQLTVIIPKSVKRERDSRRKEKRRRDAGMQLREDWLADHSRSRDKPWDKLGISRATWYRRGQPEV